jgi:hypothetical protein
LVAGRAGGELVLVQTQPLDRAAKEYNTMYLAATAAK